jgi:hypothetical protein
MAGPTPTTGPKTPSTKPSTRSRSRPNSTPSNNDEAISYLIEKRYLAIPANTTPTISNLTLALSLIGACASSDDMRDGIHAISYLLEHLATPQLLGEHLTDAITASSKKLEHIVDNTSSAVFDALSLPDKLLDINDRLSKTAETCTEEINRAAQFRY